MSLHRSSDLLNRLHRLKYPKEKVFGNRSKGILKIGLGIGLLVCVLVPVSLLLFGIVDDAQTASLILFLGGLWTVAFGAVFGGRKDRLYNVGFGIIVAILSTFIFLPLQYTAGLVVISIVVLTLASIVVRPKTGPRNVPQQVG
jgi:hypothetical protein